MVTSIKQARDVMNDEAIATAIVLLKWVQRVAEKGGSGEELAILPEAVKASAGLLEAINHC